jgi:NAD(P)-dependent dehydrogenase (short-subunit alcohol dehydrogenase family)
MATIVMTGGSSGFGVLAAAHLADGRDTRLIVGARRAETVGKSLPLDLADLASVRDFADAVRRELGDAAIDALVLNAGVVRPDAAGRTVDGFETTFAVNHLAHHLLLRLLLPALADGATVVLTTSGTHDPATGSGLLPPRHADADLLAHPDRDAGLDPRPRKAGQQAYTASKLCAVLTARMMSVLPDARARRLSAVAYCPGQVFGTGLAKDLPAPMRMVWAALGTPVGAPLRRLSPTLNTRAAAAGTLAELAAAVTTPPDGRIYAALRRGRLTWPDPSELARRDDLAEKLWADSTRLVGLPV